jgi:hypothetical protein
MSPGTRDVLARKLKYLGGRWFWAEFTDRMAAERDYSHVKDKPGPMTAPLRAKAYVARAVLEMGAPTWPNGWDASPEALYADLQSACALKLVADAERPV